MGVVVDALKGTSTTPIVDVHHHFFSPRYVQRHGDVFRKTVPAYAHVLDRTAADSVREMDAAGVATALLSLPGVWFADDLNECRDTVRDLNEHARSLRDEHPGRFGAFAVLPFPDTDGSLEEIRFALDDLSADGVGIASNYDGRHLGDAGFSPLFDELDARASTVYVHAAASPSGIGAVRGLPPHALELPFDTARTIADLVLRDSFDRWPSIRWIFSHGGGALPMLAHRFGVFADAVGGKPKGSAVSALGRIHVDTASVSNEPAMAAIRALLPPDRILFGSDYPYVTPTQELAELRRLDIPDADEIAGGGAVLFPRPG